MDLNAGMQLKYAIQCKVDPSRETEIHEVEGPSFFSNFISNISYIKKEKQLKNV